MINLVYSLMKQRIFVNLMVVLLCLGGYMSIKSINREAYPQVNFDMVSVQTIYPGGSPDEMETLITIPIEKKLREVDGIDKVRSYNIENVSVLAIYIEDTVSDKKQVVQDIKDAVDLVENLPDKAETPIVEEIKLDKTQAIDLAIYGKTDQVSYDMLRKEADDLEDYFYDIDGIAEVELIGFRDKEYLVEIRPGALTDYRIALNNVINTLRNRNVDLPGGSLKIKNREYILRTKGQYANTQEILNTVIMSNDAGFTTRVKNIGKVYDTYEEADVLQRFNGKDAIILRLWKKRSADEIKLVNVIQEKVKSYKSPRLKNINLVLFNDTSDITRERISSVIFNAATGFFLLVAILLILLGMRMSAIVATSIPIAFMVAFLAMKLGGITLNVISLFGMIMVLGMIVDFAIVVSENSHRYMESGLPKTEAIKKGVSEVFWPVTVTLVCICAAFAPLLFLTGIVGKFIVNIPIVLMVCLIASWYCAMFIMPTFLKLFAKDECKKGVECDELINEDENFESGFFGKIQKQYKRLLTISLKFRFVTLGVLIAMLFSSLMIASKIGFVFIPKGGEEAITIFTKMPVETNLDANLREMKKLEKLFLKLPKKELESLHVTVGEKSSDFLDPKPGEGTNKTTFRLNLSKEADRDRYAADILDDLRKQVIALQKKGSLSKTIGFEFTLETNGPPIGKPVNIELRGKDFDTLNKIGQTYISYLKSIKGVTDITIDLEAGKQEYRYKVNEVVASRSGVSVFDVALALNASYEGAVATSTKKGDEDVDIRVRFPESARRSRSSLKNVMVANQNGGLIPIDMVTHIERQPGLTQINRLNFKRIVQVQAEVDAEIITPIKVNNMLKEKFKNIEKKFSGYDVSYGGEDEETNKRMSEMGVLFLFALLVIYITLAVFFGSLILPIVVMAAIPFSLVGVVLALFAHGQPMSFMSTLGIFSLAGVIVSNTLVLVQFINNLRDEGLSMKDALIEGGVIRLRPVLLTTGTTVLGLFPTIYGLGGKDYFVAPLALAFGYGLIFATFITLILIPCFYHLAEEYKMLISRLAGFIGIKMEPTIHHKVIEE